MWQGPRRYPVLIWKMDGLTERQVRTPLTPTGTNLLGLVKHAAVCESIYFGSVFDRPWPTPEELPQIGGGDPLADGYARGDETREGLIDLYRRVHILADDTNASLPWHAVGRVPH